MSYDRRGGYRRRYRDDYDDRRREPFETPEDKLKTAIIKLGEVDAIEELPRLQKQIQDHLPVNIAIVSEAFRIGVTEQPYKIPYYAALIRLLHEHPADSMGHAASPLGRLILEDFWKGFQAYLDKLAWREARLCIHFFAHLTVAQLISPESMVALLQAFTAVLDEFGVSHGRAKRAALCAAEGLMISGPGLRTLSPTNVTDIVSAIQAFNDTTGSAKWLVQPTVKVFSDEVMIDNGDELLDTALFALKTLVDSDFEQTADSFPQPYANIPALDNELSQFVLPSVLVPPEIIELDALSNDADADDTAQVKKEEWPEYFLRLFDNDVSPDPNTPAGYAVRTALLDIISIFEVNRKECARLLLEYPKWNHPGSFKPKPGAPVPPEGENSPVPGKDWQLESTIIETILGAFLILPESSHKSVYYISLITELCKLSPSTVGPAVGKSIRKLYGALSEGLDVEAARRFAEWFAVHMSNFGFQWVWKEWVPDLALTVQHPRRTFMRRAIEFEIRLSYHDRILKTLPEPMQGPDAHMVPEQAPGPDYEYDDPANPHHDAAQSVLNLFRGRAKADDVIAHLDTLKTTLETTDDTEGNVDATVRSIAVQSLLNIGSRSFSHLLNAIERYLPLLRSLTSSGNTVESKAGILSTAAAFWRHNRQMVGIVFDKLMQYQIVDPTDVIAWTFANRAGGLDAFEWDLMRGALDKANGRVVIARRRVTALRKEDDDTRARAKAQAGAEEGGSAMEVDADANTKPEEVTDSPALATAIKAFTSLTREQRGALSRTLEGFVDCLGPNASDASANPNPHARTVVTESAWHNRANWDSDDWSAWETWGWYRQFCRAYSPYLRNYSNTLYTVSFARLDGSTDPATELLKKTWNVATGQDVS